MKPSEPIDFLYVSYLITNSISLIVIRLFKSSIFLSSELWLFVFFEEVVHDHRCQIYVCTLVHNITYYLFGIFRICSHILCFIPDVSNLYFLSFCLIEVYQFYDRSLYCEINWCQWAEILCTVRVTFMSNKWFIIVSSNGKFLPAAFEWWMTLHYLFKILIHWQKWYSVVVSYIVVITNENKYIFLYNFGFIFLYC